MEEVFINLIVEWVLKSFRFDPLIKFWPNKQISEYFSVLNPFFARKHFSTHLNISFFNIITFQGVGDDDSPQIPFFVSVPVFLENMVE